MQPLFYEVKDMPQTRRPKLSAIKTILLAAQPLVGGQAVMEGVMMRSPNSFAVAVRRRNGNIVVREDAWRSLSERFTFLKWPLLRGATMLIESMYNGISALNFSAAQMMEDENPEEAKKIEKDNSGFALVLSLVMGFALAILLFKGLPHGLAWGLGMFLGANGESALPIDSVGFHLVDGTIKLGIFISYILLISRMEDVKRLFMYHGAEHMAVHTWEAKEPLDVAHCDPKSTAHPRCGTSLILLVIAVSVFVFAAIFPLIPTPDMHPWLQALFTFAIKIPLMLPVAGLAYEAQRLAAKNPDTFWVRAIIAPGMMMQRLTTRRPDKDQQEVALTALRKAIWREQQVTDKGGSLKVRSRQLETFDNFDHVRQQVA
ncbi:MAG: metal-dependent enzyme [Myxococcales bacterium]|nr:metal-dependent enzyme [Myxococcales bacterium]